jgi:hypothetical protein
MLLVKGLRILAWLLLQARPGERGTDEKFSIYQLNELVISLPITRAERHNVKLSGGQLFFHQNPDYSFRPLLRGVRQLIQILD